jgi:cellulose synthase/poly-beta-1,6-N-acetylglucosamine synthase-like glycosyltransferase
MPPPRRRATLDILILARDEADVLPGTLAALAPQLSPDDRLTVVADHCEDGTATVARAMGARVFLRNGGTPGKGQALKWWLSQTRASSQPDDSVLVLDADSWVRPGFLSAMRKELRLGRPAVQAMLEQPARAASGAGTLASLSEFMEQHVVDRLWSQLGCPVRLRGTGMGFRREVLEPVASGLTTAVEDAELSVLLAAAGFPISLAPAARVLDAKPESAQAAVRQRARWLKGQLHLLQRHPRQIVVLALQGPKGWSLLSSILVKPKSLTFAARAVLWLSLMLAAPRLGPTGTALQVIVAASFLVDAVVLSIAVSLSPDRSASLRALLRFPAFVLVWLHSLVLAARSRGGWLRARPLPHEQGLTSPGPAAP